MKKIALLLLSALLGSCASNQKITAVKNNKGDLVGVANKASFQQEPYSSWFNKNYENFTPNTAELNKIDPIKLREVKVKAYLGTWCGDSKRELPKLYKVIEHLNFKKKYIEVIAVDRSKKANGLEEGHNIIRVPTFIFYRFNKEIGRFVEYPRETLEKDIVKIITGQPYKHSYEK